MRKTNTSKNLLLMKLEYIEENVPAENMKNCVLLDKKKTEQKIQKN